MIANYHTHTTRCHHAFGTEEEYCQAAIEGGLEILGFSDHTPYYFPGDYYSNFRMHPQELEDYVRSVLSCREKFADRLQAHLGVEAEYYPNELPRLLQLLRSHGVEYMILAMHFAHHEEGQLYSGRPSDSISRLENYTDYAIEAMGTGLYTYFAHPDMMNFTGDPRLFERHMTRLCRTARELEMPLEINLLGVAEERNYPNETFWRIAGQEGCKAIIGCDAHKPAMILNASAEVKARALAKKYGVEVLDRVELVRL